MSDRTAVLLVRIILIGMVVQLLVVGYVFYSNYQGRQDLVLAQRSACERAKKDRAANARGWRIAENARHAAGQNKVAKAYSLIATGQEQRSKIDCAEVFPDAGVFP